jgi:hypothetical protein
MESVGPWQSNKYVSLEYTEKEQRTRVLSCISAKLDDLHGENSIM